MFFNNEDYSNPAARIWFYRLARAITERPRWAFNGYEQGGVNTEGLAFVWVAGQKEELITNPSLLKALGNPMERMLENCVIVEKQLM